VNPDKFSYILDDENQTKQISDFGALKLAADYFERHSVEEFKAHLKNLLLEFHPDKNEKKDEIRATESTKRIITASTNIKNNIERNDGEYKSNDEFDEFIYVSNEFESDFESIFEWLNNELKNMQALLKKAQNLSDQDTVVLIGEYTPLEDSLIWALECLRELQINIIPALERIGDNDTLKILRSEIPRTLERAGVNVNEEMPPKGSEKFESLLNALNNSLSTAGAYPFSLTEPASILMTRFNPKLFVAPSLLTQPNQSTNEEFGAEKQQISEREAPENERNEIIEDAIIPVEKAEFVEVAPEISHVNSQVEPKIEVDDASADAKCINSSAADFEIMECLTNANKYLEDAISHVETLKFVEKDPVLFHMNSLTESKEQMVIAQPPIPKEAELHP
jgi:hypothetical protein